MAAGLGAAPAGAAVRLGIISGTPASRGPDGRLMINHSIGRLLEALRARFPGARLCLPLLPQGTANHNHILDWPPGDVATLAPLHSTIAAQRHVVSTARALRRFVAGVDALFIRLPFQLPYLLFGLGKPKLLHVVSDPLAVVRASDDYHGVARLAAVAYGHLQEWTMARLVAESRTRVATNGRAMWDKLGGRHGRVVVSSCLRLAEIQPRSPGPGAVPPRLLFLGYIRPEKGAAVLLDAFERLRARRPVSLTLAGGSDRKTGAEAALLARVRDSRYAKDVTVTGMVDFGPALFDLYRTHDVFVLPSLAEGTPRTLGEARAFGCPVVASRVGGVPSSVEHEVDGLLVPPADAAALAAAIERLLDDAALRARLVAAGIERCGHATLESFADALADEVRTVASGGSPA